MSGGRVELGLGSGWYGAEHEAYGIPFPKEKFGRLEEQLAIVTGLWRTPVGERFSFNGTYYQLKDSPALPKPAQNKVPVLIGGHGAKRTPALAAQYADEFNIPFASLSDTEQQFKRVRAVAEEHGRSAGSLVYSNALVACVGKTDAHVRRRAATIGRDVDELKANGLDRLARRGRRADRRVPGRRLAADVSPDARPGRPGPLGADRHRGDAPAFPAHAPPGRLSS